MPYVDRVKYFLWLTILVFPAAIAGQCNVKIDKAPVIATIELGMTSEQAIAKLGEPADRDILHLGYTSKDLKVQKPVVPGRSLNLSSSINGIERISVSLYDKKVTSISVKYSPREVKWSSVKEFADTVSHQFSLPNAWVYDAGLVSDPVHANIWCADFIIAINTIENTVYLEDRISVQP